MSEQKTSFFENVYEVVRLVPEGRVTTYGTIAKYLGSPRNARIVGWAMNAAVNYNNIPAHRVVNSRGELSGSNHFSTTALMRELLEAEGVIVSNNKVLNFSDIIWDPSKELI